MRDGDRGRTDRRPDPRREPSTEHPRPLRSPKLAPLLEAEPSLLDNSVRRDLRSLTPENAELVARHLVSAGMLIDEEPARALAHAQAARSTASRLAVVREAVGVSAYAAGEWALALSELRAVRRMTGSWEHLPLLADCERALGRPRKAIDLAAEALAGPGAKDIDEATAVELAIVVSGARRDLGEGPAAVVALQGRLLDASDGKPWTVRLWYAYAEALLAAGRVDEARDRFRAVASLDDDGETDAEERFSSL